MFVKMSYYTGQSLVSHFESGIDNCHASLVLLILSSVTGIIM